MSIASALMRGVLVSSLAAGSYVAGLLTSPLETDDIAGTSRYDQKLVDVLVLTGVWRKDTARGHSQ